MSSKPMILSTLLFLLISCLSIRCDSESVTDFQIKNQQEIRSIVVVTRHGDRNVLTSYPGDPNVKTLDKLGWGLMRSDGCYRLYKSGENLAKNLLPVMKKRNRTYLRAASNPFPLVIKSLECFMAGVYGPEENLNSTTDPPIEVPYGPTQIDLELNFGRVPCPVKQANSISDPKFVALKNRFSHLIERLANGTGEDLNEKGIVEIVITRTEPIVDAENMGLKRASFVDDDFIRESIAAGAAEFDLIAKVPVQRNLSSFFVKELISKLRTPNDVLSVACYASVSTTMVPIMETVGLWTGIRPTYGEAMIFIARKDDTFEQYFYGQNLQLVRRKPRGCKHIDSCTVDEFEREMKPFYTDDWQRDCRLKDDVKDKRLF